MLFLTTELAKKAVITIFSARDKPRPGFKAGKSWVVIKGYIKPCITRSGHLGLKPNRVLRFVNFCSFTAFSDVIPWLARLFYFLLSLVGWASILLDLETRFRCFLSSGSVLTFSRFLKLQLISNRTSCRTIQV